MHRWLPESVRFRKRSFGPCPSAEKYQSTVVKHADAGGKEQRFSDIVCDEQGGLPAREMTWMDARDCFTPVAVMCATRVCGAWVGERLVGVAHGHGWMDRSRVWACEHMVVRVLSDETTRAGDWSTHTEDGPGRVCPIGHSGQGISSTEPQRPGMASPGIPHTATWG